MLWLTCSIDCSKTRFQCQLYQLSGFFFFPCCTIKNGRKSFHILLKIIMNLISICHIILQQLIKIIEMSSLEGQLIESKIPFPKYYNGYSWNTIIDKNRKNIPKYLREDLPSLKLIHIRQQFKKAQIVDCPRLTFFQSKIYKQAQKYLANERFHKNNEPQNTNSVYMEDMLKKLKKQLKNIKFQMQYALMTADKNSNVIKKLLQKAQQIETQIQIIKDKTKYKSKDFKKRSKSVISKIGNCFQNTLQLVFLSKKQNLKVFMCQEEKKENIQSVKKVQQINLLPYI